MQLTIQIDDNNRSDESRKPWTAISAFASTVGIGETPQEAVMDLLNRTDWDRVTGQPAEGRSCPCGTTWTAPVDDCPSCGPGGDRDRARPDLGGGAGLNPDTQELDIAGVILETRLREASESVKSTADLLALYRSARPAGLSPR